MANVAARPNLDNGAVRRGWWQNLIFIQFKLDLLNINQGLTSDNDVICASIGGRHDRKQNKKECNNCGQPSGVEIIYCKFDMLSEDIHRSASAVLTNGATSHILERMKYLLPQILKIGVIRGGLK